jgi:hypothetical protein
MRAHFQVARTKSVRLFNCEHCDHEQDAEVIGIGEGAASDLNAPGTLRERAERAARADVRATLAVARCPKCGKRSGVAKWWLRHVGPVALTMLGIALAGWVPLFVDMNMKEDDKWICGWVMTGIAVVVGVPMTLISVLPKWGSIDARVKFL